MHLLWTGLRRLSSVQHTLRLMAPHIDGQMSMQMQGLATILQLLMKLIQLVMLMGIFMQIATLL